MAALHVAVCAWHAVWLSSHILYALPSWQEEEMSVYLPYLFAHAIYISFVYISLHDVS